MKETYRIMSGLCSIALAWMLLPASLAAQSGSSTSGSVCKAGSNDAACAKSDNTPAPAKPPGAQFPFPVEDSKHGGEDQRNAAPEMQTSGVPDPPASSDRPLTPPAGSSSSSSSSDAPGAGSSSTADDDADVAPTKASPDASVKASALKDLGSRGDTSMARAKLEQTRVTDDLKVGSFYLKDGNNQGAYLRYRDAVDRAPEDPDARFGLAEAAGKLSKHDEAVLNYRECLRLDPAGDHDKASRKALQRLGVVAR